MYDYVIFNDDLDEAYAQLATVARRALAGQSGNGSGSIAGPVTLVAEEETTPAQQASGASASAVHLAPSFWLGAGHPRLWQALALPCPRIADSLSATEFTK